MPEHRIVGSPQREERLVPRREYFPSFPVFFNLCVLGGYWHQGWEDLCSDRVGLVGERRVIGSELRLGEFAGRNSTLHQPAGVGVVDLLGSGEPRIEPRPGTRANRKPSVAHCYPGESIR